MSLVKLKCIESVPNKYVHLDYLKKMELRKAQEQFVRGRVDPREVISLFPRMLPSSSNFTRAIPSLHDIADINQVNYNI